MAFSIKVHHDIDPHMLDSAASRADEILATQAMKDTVPFVPASTLTLTRMTRVKGANIVYQGPYARYLYHGKLMVDPRTGSPWASKGTTKTLTNRNLVFNKTVHGDAQSAWFEASKAQNKEKWLRVYKKAVLDNK